MIAGPQGSGPSCHRPPPRPTHLPPSHPSPLVQQTFLVANFEACVLYFVAVQEGLGDDRCAGSCEGSAPSGGGGCIRAYWAFREMVKVGVG